MNNSDHDRITASKILNYGITDSSLDSTNNNPKPDSLLDISARIVAENEPFQRVEEKYDRIPEPVQRRIIYWSFPRDERDIQMYSSLSRASSFNASDSQSLSFCKGLKLLESNCVESVLQVGNNNNASANDPNSSNNSAQYSSEENKKYKVSVSFDRCKITSVTCSCDTKDIFWCPHVVALALYRIRNANSVKLRVPISETLLQMNRQQLQKFVQYLIAEHHTEVLPTAQKLADEILHHKSEINSICGAPDPTAGASKDDENSWHLDEMQVCEAVRSYLGQGSYYNSNKQLNCLFGKVREMLRAQDSNGARMLTLITEQFLHDPRLVLWKSHGTPMTEKCRQLWDQLGSLWVCIVLNPRSSQAERYNWRDLLEKWSKIDVCPQEDPDFRPPGRESKEILKIDNLNYLEQLKDADNENEEVNNIVNENPQNNPEENSNEEQLNQAAEAEAEAEAEGDDQKNKLKKNNRRDLFYDQNKPNKKLKLNNGGSVNKNSNNTNKTPRTIFHKALDAVNMTWDNDHLKNILASDAYSLSSDNSVQIAGSSKSVASNATSAKSNFNSTGQPLWHEPMAMCAARIDSLRSHGHIDAALRLSVSVVRTMKQLQRDAQNLWHKYKPIPTQPPPKYVASASINDCNNSKYFPLDAVACIFDCLTEACITTTDVATLGLNGRLNGISPAVEDSNIIAPKYKHIQVPGSKDATETFLSLAFEAAILALGKQRIMPQGLYSQHLICKQQDQLIARLRNVDLDQLLVEIIKNLSIQMMDGGPTSGFGESIHPESVPMHTLARFLFASLLNQYPDLAFKIGLRAMRFPILENVRSDPSEGSSSSSAANANYVNSPYPRWWTLGHLESQQCSLSSTMLSASKGDKIRLASVLENARHNIHSSTHLFKLAQDAFRFATPENGPRSQTLLGVAFELGLQVMRMTLTCLNWRRREMVRWLVTCATQLGLDATISIMQNWYELFTPTEATGPVATTIMSHSTILRLNLSIKQQEDLSSCARTLALQCATKDPPNCALNALTLCENDPMAFEAAYHIVIDAANQIMTSSQLFTIARYMEHRGFPVRAYNLAILAMKNVHLAYNQDSHPAINDIHWACALSHTLGKAELSKIIPLVVKNVQCATVLSDILRRCSVPNPGLSHFSGHHRGNNMRSCTKLSYDREPLNQLLEAAVAAYVNTTHSRLSHISPRHYGDFIDFLSKARDTFVLARDGPAHFSRLIENITIAYKGKKKLVRQVRQRFY
ncbi:unnamed protein product [Diamesa hyperborea]